MLYCIFLMPAQAQNKCLLQIAFNHQNTVCSESKLKPIGWYIWRDIFTGTILRGLIVKLGREGGDLIFRRLSFYIVHMVSKHLMCLGMGCCTKTAERGAQNITLP